MKGVSPMRVTLALAVVLAACGKQAAPPTNCTLTLAGVELRCVYSAATATAPLFPGGTAPVWGLFVEGFRDEAQQDRAALAWVQFAQAPAIGTTYVFDPTSAPAAPPAAAARRFADPPVDAAPTHAMASPLPGTPGVGSLSVTFTAVRYPTTAAVLPSSATGGPPPTPAPTHGALDATLVATDGSGETLALRVDF